MNLQVLLYAFLGGVLPALLWLWFWLKEDSVHPEPRGLIVVTFFAGAVAVMLTLPLQQGISYYFQENATVLFILLALVEETLKFLAAYLVALRNRAFDEPIDAVIYMVTVALGFSALENAIFLFNSIATGNAIDGVITGNLRFVGASVLHVLASSVVGLGLAFSFYKSKIIRFRMLILSIFTAAALHALFNLSIINDGGRNMLVTFLVLWFLVVGLLLFFEKIKRLTKINTT